MDWEKKFSTIVHETEANLERVRKRLQAAKDSSDAAVSPITSTGAVPQLQFALSTIGKTRAAAGDSTYQKVTGGSVNIKMAEDKSSPPIWATVLDEKYSKQQKTVETLIETVVSLQTEKEQQKTIIELLTDRVDTLQERLEEKGIDLDTENKLHQWKLETSHEISALKQQVQQQRNESVPAPSNQSMEYMRGQVRDATQLCRDEAESARKDIDYYKTRMTRLEKNISGLSDELEVLTRRHNDLNSDVTSFKNRYTSDYRELSSGMREKQVDINITRDELSALKADVADGIPSQTPQKSVTLNRDLRVAGSKHLGKEDKPLPPTQWRELLSHSLSTLSVDSHDSTLSSGYLARRRSQDSHLDEPDNLMAGPVVWSDEELSTSSDEELGEILSTPSASPPSLSLDDL